MKIAICKGLLVLVMASLFEGAALAEDVADAGTRMGIAIVAVGDADPALIQAVAEHLGKHLLLTPAILPAQSPVGSDDLVKEAQAIESLKGDTYGAVVGIVSANPSVTDHGAVYPEKGVGLINLTALSADGPEAEALVRRVDKESLRAMALLLGMEPCVNPLCALWHYKTIEQLDRKGRTLCPPCYVKFEKRHGAGAAAAAATP